MQGFYTIWSDSHLIRNCDYWHTRHRSALRLKTPFFFLRALGSLCFLSCQVLFRYLVSMSIHYLWHIQALFDPFACQLLMTLIRLIFAYHVFFFFESEAVRHTPPHFGPFKCRGLIHWSPAMHSFFIISCAARVQCAWHAVASVSLLVLWFLGAAWQ